MASGIEGIQDAVQHGKNGYLLPAKDVQAWVNMIHLLLQKKNTLKTLGQEAKQFILDNYSWDLMSEEYQKVFEEIALKNKTIAAYMQPL